MRSFAPTVAGLRAPLFWLVLLAGPLGACSHYKHFDARSTIPDDYHLRHPIVLANAPKRLDVFPVGESGKLDKRQSDDVRAFAADYKTNGQGAISAVLPTGADPVATRKTLNAVRRILAQSGVHGSMLVGHYAVVDPRLASPVQLSFVKLQARVASRCGQWPDDLASGSSEKGWQNRTYYNFGCATQKDFAMQIDDPRDLVRARTEGPSDVEMRTRAIENIRQGLDPGTQWAPYSTTINSVGGTN